MRIVKQWFATASPLVKMLMAVSITSMLAVGHKLYYAPYARRQRLLQAEEWAKTVIELEEANEDTNIVYK